MQIPPCARRFPPQPLLPNVAQITLIFVFSAYLTLKSPIIQKEEKKPFWTLNFYGFSDALLVLWLFDFWL